MQSQLPPVDITVLPGSGRFPHLARPRAVAEILFGIEKASGSTGSAS
jgi:hypothetical protein